MLDERAFRSPIREIALQCDGSYSRIVLLRDFPFPLAGSLPCNLGLMPSTSFWAANFRPLYMGGSAKTDETVTRSRGAIDLSVPSKRERELKGC